MFLNDFQGVSLDVQDGNAGSSEAHDQFNQVSELSEVS